MANEVEITVKASDKTERGFAAARRGIQRLKDSADRLGTGVSGAVTGLVSTIVQGVAKAAGQIQEGLSGALSGGLQGALSSGPVGLAIVAGLAIVLAAAAPAIAALIAGALVLGFGAAFLAVGAFVLMQNEGLMKKIGKQWEGIKGTLERAFAPLIPVLEFAMKILADLAKQFEPVIKAASAMAAGPLKGFLKELSKAFLELKPAIQPLMEAFTAIISALGPMLKVVFSSIADSLIEMADAVIENKDIIAAMFAALLYIIPRVIDVIRVLTNWFGEMVRFVMNKVVPGTISAVNAVKSAWNTVVGAVSNVVGRVKTFFSGLISFVQGLPGKVSSVASRIFTSIQTAASNIVNRAKTILQNIVSFIRGLPGQIASAASGMFNGIISAAQNAVSRAGSLIASIPGKIKGAIGFSRGGIIGAATGGARGGQVLVGEAGPEIVDLPYGSRVNTAGRTRSMLGDGGGVTYVVNLYVAGSIRSDRDIVKIIKDEFVNGGFRGAVPTS